MNDPTDRLLYCNSTIVMKQVCEFGKKKKKT